MKIKHAIVAGALLFMVGCETTGNTTGTTSRSNDAGSSSATAGTSTSGNTNPATTSTNARGTLTEGSTAAGSGTTTTTTSPATSSGTTMSGTNSSSTSPNPTTQSGTTANANTANTSTMNSAGTTGTTASGTPQTGTTNNSMNQTSAGVNNSSTAGSAGTFSVPSTYQSAFSTRYPKASNVQWSRYSSTDVPIDWELTDWAKMDNDDYVVRYNIGTDPYYSWYDSEGNWVGTSAAMKNTSGLPSAINTMLANKYKGYTISSAHTEYWKDRTAYEIEMKSGTTKVKLLVDANGNVIKEKTKTQ